MQAYERDRNGWTWVPVQDILQNAVSSVDFDYIDWEHIIRQKAKDTGFLHLVWKIMEEGWKSAIGWQPEDGHISEGHHRLVAAILLCEELIPTTFYGTDLYKSDSAYTREQSAHSHTWDSQEPAPLYLEDF